MEKNRQTKMIKKTEGIEEKEVDERMDEDHDDLVEEDEDVVEDDAEGW